MFAIASVFLGSALTSSGSTTWPRNKILVLLNSHFSVPQNGMLLLYLAKDQNVVNLTYHTR